MATKVSQRPKVTKKSPAKARKVGGGKSGVKHVSGLHQQEKKTAGGKSGRGSISTTNKMPPIVEYPGEGKGKGFGPGVKVIGQRG